MDDQGVDVSAARLQRLLTSKGQQMLGQVGPLDAAALIMWVIWAGNFGNEP